MKPRFRLVHRSLLWVGWGAVACTVCLPAAPIDKLTYHNDAQRSGWNPHEVQLTPATVSFSSFGQVWQSPQLDSVDGRPPRLYATPLYADQVAISSGPFQGEIFSVIYAATDLGYVYAVNAADAGGVPAGTILWSKRLVDALPRMDVLSTPVIDWERQRLYTVCADSNEIYQVHALDVRSGEEQPGWPVAISPAAVNAPGINRNGTTRFPPELLIQRSALNLSPDGARLYVAFAEGVSSGWIVAVDIERAAVATAFSTTARSEEVQGGMWASGGPSVDREGYVYIATGSSVQVHLKKLGLPGIYLDSEHNWAQSLIRLRDDPATGFELVGTYTPFNYAQAQVTDIDLGSSGTTVVDLDPASTSTPHLLVLGGKQGNIYLLDRAHLPGSLVKRPPVSHDSSTDGSLLSPEIQPHLGKRGPFNVFGPYADENAMNNQARSRTTMGYFRSAEGKPYVFITGSAKTGPKLDESTPPGLVRLEIITHPGQPAYLKVDQREGTQTFHNPGSPVVTSHGGRDAIVWVLDANAPRTTPLHGPTAPRPVLYAFDALTFKLLWRSAPDELATSGKYNEPTVVRGLALVGTDRIQAFSLLPAPSSARPVFPPLFAATTAAAPPVALDSQLLQTGKLIFEQRCALCHNSGQPGIPTRATISQLPTTKVIETLINGIMKPQATGLTNAEVNAVSAYVTSLPAPARASTPPETVTVNLAGRALYVQHCITCHMPDGSGVPSLQPSLRDSPLVRGEPSALIRTILHGPVDGHAYGPVLSNQDAADLLTYIRQAFGHDACAVESGDITAQRHP